jgi:phenylalanyl-tRNA synthetase beta chain
MRVPLSWLKDYVPLPANPAELIDRLTLAGLECEGVQVFGLPVPAGVRVKPEDQTPVWDRDKIVVAKVLSIEKVPGADKLKFVTVDHGAAEPKRVITGAPNIAPGESGMKVILGLRGCRYYFQNPKKPDEPKAVVTLEPRKLMGFDNDAMCMSNFELGIAEDHDGIIVLDESDPAPGTPLQDVLGEVVVDLAVLPNMARCLSLVGVAREVSALTGMPVTEPDLSFPTSPEPAAGKVKIEIADPTLCRRYSAAVIRNVTIGPAPRWMRTRVQYAGMRPITNAVDVTNYVMLELGQPLHAFDFDVLVSRAGGKPPTITVRPAKPGETLKTLDGQVRELSPEDLLIADTAGPIALAGVMGGLETEVTEKTKTILLEAANFDPVSVRKTARKFNLFSEASSRFTKGVHPEVVKAAALRACQLFHRHAGGDVLAGLVDNYPAPLAPQVVDLRRSEIERVQGVPMPDGEVERTLTALQFKLEPTPWGWGVTVPPTRLDIQVGAADLIEELARVSGYDRLPETLIADEVPPPRTDRPLELEEHVRDLLADAGLQECVTYSLTSVELESKLVSDASQTRPNHVTLLNPISPERAVLRQSLLPGLLEVARRNFESVDSVSLFEIGPAYLPQGVLPVEPKRLALILSGRRTPAAWDDPQGENPAGYDFFDLKGILEGLAADLHLPTSFRKVTTPHVHPGKSAEWVIGDKGIGSFGELHPKVAESFGLADRAVLVAEVDLDALLAAVPERVAYRPFSTHPPAKRDLAVIVPADTPAESVRAEILAAGGDLLIACALFDRYTGESIPAGTKSLAFALTYQAPDRTLGDKEIDKAHQKIEGRLKHVLKAQIRGKE